MVDVRQGDLPAWADPFATAADLVVNGGLRRMKPDELEAFLAPREPRRRPTLTAWKGYDGPGQWFYFDGAIWRDTQTDEAWDGKR